MFLNLIEIDIIEMFREDFILMLKVVAQCSRPAALLKEYFSAGISL